LVRPGISRTRRTNPTSVTRRIGADESRAQGRLPDARHLARSKRFDRTELASHVSNPRGVLDHLEPAIRLIEVRTAGENAMALKQ